MHGNHHRKRTFTGRHGDDGPKLPTIAGGEADLAQCALGSITARGSKGRACDDRACEDPAHPL
jgi:hypothetical protein